MFVVYLPHPPGVWYFIGAMTLSLSACILHFFPNTASVRIVCPITPVRTTKDALNAFGWRSLPSTSHDCCTLLLSVDHCTEFYGRWPAHIPIFRKSTVMLTSIELVNQSISASTVSLLCGTTVTLLSTRFAMFRSQAFRLQCQRMQFSNRFLEKHTNQPMTVVTIKSSLAILSSKQPSLML